VALLIFGPLELLSKPWEYDAIARNLWAGNGFVSTGFGAIYRAELHPLYPWFCALIYTVVGEPSIPAIQWVQIALVPLVGVVAYRLGRELGSPWVGVAAAAGVLFHPGLAIFSVRPHALWLDSLLFLTVAWLVIRAGRSVRRIAPAVALGAVLGLAMLGRSSVVGAVPLLIGWLLFRWRGQPYRWGKAALVLAVTAVVVTPWLIRNWMVFGRPTCLMTTSGYGLWLGHHARSTGGALDEEGRALIDVAPSFAGRLEAAGTEIAQMDLFSREAWAYIKADPWLAWQRTAIKFWQFWAGSHQTGMWYPQRWRFWYSLYYGVLWVMLIIGSWSLWRQGYQGELTLVLGFAIAVSLVQSLFFVEGRHRWEVEGLLVVVAIAGVMKEWRRWRSAQTSHVAGTAK
jgi:hypothetical protein